MTPRRGFTLIETMLAMAVLTSVVLVIGLGITKLQRSVGNSNIRTRAYARADVQIAMARSWPTWSTLENLSAAGYNGTKDGLVTSTTVAVDTTGNMRIKRIAVTVTSEQTGALPTPVKRAIAIAAP
jgi:prepilin-type N-terminal cleavage/methylation domain-containing protein